MIKIRNFSYICIAWREDFHYPDTFQLPLDIKVKGVVIKIGLQVDILRDFHHGYKAIQFLLQAFNYNKLA
jgi:hypothetical protein